MPNGLFYPVTDIPVLFYSLLLAGRFKLRDELNFY
jgi:hypothetical protein